MASTDRARSRVGRRILRVSAILLLVIAVGIPFYVCPQADSPRHADAIFVLGGYGFERYRLGLELAQQGWADRVVASNPGGPDNARLTRYCDTPQRGITIDCFDPHPSRTKGEGRELVRLARENGWNTVIVVTFRPHISRARFILEQCFKGTLIMVASPTRVGPLRWVYEYGYQTAGYLRALAGTEC